jgi:dTMP kinase
MTSETEREHDSLRFIAFEGADGAGKTTQARLLAAHLRARGDDVVEVREPGGTPTGESVRAIVLEGTEPVGARAEALLFAAARAELVAEVIRPALERGAVVLSDRYLDSSLAYQGGARGLGRGPVEAVNRFATGGLLPDLVVLLDLDPADGLARRARDPDRIESQDIDFHRRVREAFRDLAAADPGRFAVIDATAPVPEVATRVQASVLALLEEP